MKTSADLSKEEYAETVWYCRSCHSLAVIQDHKLSDDDEDGWDGSYCADCNSTDIVEGSFGDWLKEEERRKRKRKEIEWSKL